MEITVRQLIEKLVVLLNKGDYVVEFEGGGAAQNHPLIDYYIDNENKRIVFEQMW